MRRMILVVVMVACGRPKAAPETPSAAVDNVYQPPKVEGSRRWDWFPDDRTYMEDLLKDLRQTGERAPFPRLVELVDHTALLVRNADAEGLSKDQVLAAYVAFEDQMTDPVGEAIRDQLDDLREIMRRRHLAREDDDGNPFR